MKKYFVTSDIHSFYTEFKAALDNAGFDLNNPDHILIVCGDIFDRGTQPLEVYNFLRNLPIERRILIRGNHEGLLKDLYNRKQVLQHDIHNGTADTLAYVAKMLTTAEYNKRSFNRFIKKKEMEDFSLYYEKRYRALEKRDYKLFHNDKLVEILNWIDSAEWCNYYELPDYILVHGWIPTSSEDWRNASVVEWEGATWACPWDKYKRGTNKTGKTIICGHWATADIWNNLCAKNYDMEKQNPIFYVKGIDLIGLDACTAATHGVNILVINEDMTLELYNHNRRK